MPCRTLIERRDALPFDTHEFLDHANNQAVGRKGQPTGDSSGSRMWVESVDGPSAAPFRQLADTCLCQNQTLKSHFVPGGKTITICEPIETAAWDVPADPFDVPSL